MIISYSKDMLYQYMLVELDAKYKADFRLSMILNNNLTGFLPVRLQQADGTCLLQYEITGLYSLEQYLDSRKIAYREMVYLMLQFCSAVQEAEQFLLEADGILLEPACIYMNAGMERVYFCYYPGENGTIFQSMNRLSRYMIEHIDFADRKSSEMAYFLFQESLKEHVSIAALLRCIEVNFQEEPEATQECLESEMIIEQKGRELADGEETAEITRKKQEKNGLIGILLAGGILFLFLFAVLQLWRKLEYMQLLQGVSLQIVFGIVVLLAVVVLCVMTIRRKGN